MPSSSAAARARADACPGVIALHEAADGWLARVRVPGGSVSRDQLSTLAELAGTYGNGGLELTSRANLQLRGLAPDAANGLAARVAAVGLLPSATHERVRNVVASPLSGIDGAGADVTPLVAALDRGLCARAELAQLPGRFLFAVDDGRGDVAGLGADLTLVVDGNDAIVAGVRVDVADAVALALDLAAAFLAVRRAQGSRVWRIAELDGGIAAVRAQLSVSVRGVSVVSEVGDRTAPRAPVGLIAQSDGGQALAAVVPFGSLDAAQLRILVASAGVRGVRFTPWRSVIVPDLAAAPAVRAEAAQVGLGVDAESPWLRVSACTGRPGCASALADVRSDALRQLDRWPGQSVRWSGCERRCGRPGDTAIDVVATEHGYDITAVTP